MGYRVRLVRVALPTSDSFPAKSTALTINFPLFTPMLFATPKCLSGVNPILLPPQ